MDSDEILEKAQSYLTMEQEFHHRRVVDGCKNLENTELLEIVDIVHTNYLVRNEMFNKLVSYCIKKGVTLPPMSSLITEREA